MYFRSHAQLDPDRVAVLIAATGQALTYRELDEQATQLARRLQHDGLGPGDHIAVLTENHIGFVVAIAAASRIGIYYTPVNSHLTVDEVVYIVNDCRARAVITTAALLPVAAAALAECSGVERWYVFADGQPVSHPFQSVADAVRGENIAPIQHERLGLAMMYSSGTTGKPKGIRRPLSDVAPADSNDAARMGSGLMKFRRGMTLLIPAPLYHAAPHAALAAALQLGGTSIVMARFDAEELLSLIDDHRVTHVQVVPTMFNRLLALPETTRASFDLTSLEAVVHSAAPCPVHVKAAMIEWLGPIVYEYYGATESYGFTRCSSAEWLAHPGTVGRAVLGTIRVLDDDANAVAAGEIGTIWFEGGSPFDYVGSAVDTDEAGRGGSALRTVGDVGYLDGDGYLYLTDRKNFMIVSGGVNIYPQEVEDVLTACPEVDDAAVIGIPNEDFGEEVKGVVVVATGYVADSALEQRLIDACRLRLARFKCPRSVDFVDSLPRLETGKLAKHLVRDAYLVDSGRPLAAVTVATAKDDEQ